MLTKDEVSDLRSLIQSADERSLSLFKATMAKNEADRLLANWLMMHTGNEIRDESKAIKIKPLEGIFQSSFIGSQTNE